MDCPSFERLLERVLAGALSAEEEAAILAHLAACARCSDLLAVVRGERDPLPEALGETLTCGVLARTTGSACGRARELLADLADGTLAADDAELVASHLAHCRPCAALARILAQLSWELPSLVEIEPDRDFLREVLSRTSGVAPSAAAPRALWWQRLWHRPRIALELAYSAALLLTLLTAIPGSPLRMVSPLQVGAASARLATAPAHLAATWSTPVDDARRLWENSEGPVARVGELGQQTWARVSAPVSARSRGAGSWIRTTAARVGGVLQVVGDHARRVEAAIGVGDWPRAWVTICELWPAARQRWQQSAPAAPLGSPAAGAGDPAAEPTEP